MATSGGPDIVRNGLVFCIDASSPRGTSPLGNSLFNGASALANNLVGSKEDVNALNGTYIGGLDFYTIFAIDYPESSFGGDGAGREGITPGLNVRSGGKTFDYGRALHYSIYDNITQAFVKHTTYDSYTGTGPVDTFISEYNSSIITYPDATHIIAGSHRDSYHTTAQYEILRDLGAPSNVDSIIGFSSPEWILVGKPGLGAGNAYGWVFQNYDTDPTRVAHLNVGLPIHKNAQNYFTFDGTDDYMSAGTTPTELQGNPAFTVEGVFKRNGTIIQDGFWGIGGGTTLQGICSWNYILNNEIGIDLWSTSTYGTGQTYSDTEWKHIVWTYNGTSFTTSNISIFVNGVKYTGGSLITRRGGSGTPNINTDGIVLGKIHSGTNNYNANGEISNFKVYNRVLSDTEIQQNYNAYKNRFDI